MIPALIKVLESYADLPLVRVVTMLRAQEVMPTINEAWQSGNNRPPAVFIDPPYKKGTSYPNGTFPREDVVDFSLRWWWSGAFVMVSESEPIPELVEQGWSVECIHKGRADTSRFRGQQAEYVTYTGEPCGA